MHIERRSLAAALLMLAALPSAASAAGIYDAITSATATEAVIYGMKGGNYGSNPATGLVMDSAGAVYGTAGGGRYGGGVVFKLTPPASGQTAWTYAVLHSFGNTGDGSEPRQIAIDSTGTIYGTTRGGGPNWAGTVYQLTPPPSGSSIWGYAIIHDFPDGTANGYNPYAGVLIDTDGSLYGTTADGGTTGYGTVFKLTPPAAGSTTWTQTLLKSFAGGSDGANPHAGLVKDAAGYLYGSTSTGGSYDGGVLFRLRKSTLSSSWIYSKLRSFRSTDGGAPADWPLTLAPTGVIYSTLGSNVVYSLTPPVSPAISWTFKKIYTFSGAIGYYPGGPLSLDPSGTLYGANEYGGSYGYGTFYKLSPPDACHASWTRTVIYNFAGSSDGAYPMGPFVKDTTGAFIGAAYQGGGANDYGAIYRLTP